MVHDVDQMYLFHQQNETYDLSMKGDQLMPSIFPDFFAVEHALKIKVAKITSNIFFKFLLNIIFSPGFVMWFISNY